MDPKIRNFKALEKFSQEHRRETLDLIETWEEFTEENPEVLRFQTAEEFYEYARQNPQKNIDTSIWIAKELRDAQPYVRQETPSSPNQESNKQNSMDFMGALGVSALLTSAVMNKPKILEEDGKYMRISSDLQKKWLKENPGKDFSSKEGLDYLYGSLENKDGPNLHKEAEKLFRENPQNAGRIERYDKEKTKVYKNPQDDPLVRYRSYVLWEHAKVRYYLLKKGDPSIKFDSVLEQIKNKAWEDFALDHPQKAEAYAQKHSEIGKAYKLVKARLIKKESSIQEQLKDYQKTSGKEIKYVEKTHRPQDISMEDATRRLEGIATPLDKDKYAINPPQEENKQKKNLIDYINEAHQKFNDARRTYKYLKQFRKPGFQARPRIPKTGARSIGRTGTQAARGASRVVGRGAMMAGRAGMMAARGAAMGLMAAGWPVLIAIGVILLLVIIIVVISGGAGSQNPSSSQFLDYSIPFKDSSVKPSDPEDAKKLILEEFPKAKIEYWDMIVDESVKNNWNPAFVLTLWAEETGASHHTKTQNGGGNDGSISPISLGHLGCAPLENQTIEESLGCLFKNFSSYGDSEFEKFMRRYSGEQPTGPFVINPDFPSRIKKYYLMLVPSGISTITLPPGFNVSCPIPNGRIICGSYGPPESWGGFWGSCRADDTGNGGHCNKNYINDVGICQEPVKNGNLIRTAKSIDIQASGQKQGDPVYLPTINGKIINWVYKETISAGKGFGWMRLFESEPTPEGTWSLHLVHVNNNDLPLVENQSYPSGAIGGTLFDLGSDIHVHITIGLDINNSLSDLQNYNPGWKFTDRDIHMCTQ